MAGMLMLCVRMLASLLMLAGVIWGCGALWFQWAPKALAVPVRAWAPVIWAGLGGYAISLLWLARGPRGLLIYGLMFVVLLVWWSSIKPSQQRDWAADVSRQLSGEVAGSLVYLHNVRNFDWHDKDHADERWEERVYDLDQLVSVDMATSYWMGPAIAHTLVSFGFADGTGPRRYLTFSVEIRKEKNEAFSSLGGFFKEFEQSLVAADERDILRVRTNMRGEEVYLDSVAMSRPAMRELFLAYVAKANALVRRPAFYHTLFANCTTIVFDMVRGIVPGLPLDWRLLANGYLPQYLDSLHALAPHDDFAVLQEAGHINARAIQAASDEDFSQAIRRGVPQVTGSR